MSRTQTSLVAMACGLLFGGGLVLSGMASPQKVLAFLTLGPRWDASLLFVMSGALAVTVPGFWWLRKRARPWMSDSFARPPGAALDGKLLAGAALFGIGWGLSGYCPGPAVVGAALGQVTALILLPAMLLGAGVVRVMEARLRPGRSLHVGSKAAR